ncbi:MAG: hypothetical protein Q7S13_03515, partial [Candidatus Omnitrophota bacterium]|nr:hypothetical protein [Candidatus Omnitrophota bacterium]
MGNQRYFRFVVLSVLGILWIYVFVHFPNLRFFTVTVPLIIGINVAHPKSVRNIFISLFVIVWLGIFHYESTRAFFLEPLFHRPLYKFKFLFPPAGWIMF